MAQIPLLSGSIKSSMGLKPQNGGRKMVMEYEDGPRRPRMVDRFAQNGYNFEKRLNFLDFSDIKPINRNIGQNYSQIDNNSDPIMGHCQFNLSPIYFNSLIPVYEVTERYYELYIARIGSNSHYTPRSDSELVNIIMNEENPDESSSIPPFHKILPNREFPYLLGDKNSSCSSPDLIKDQSCNSEDEMEILTEKLKFRLTVGTPALTGARAEVRK